MSEENLCPFSKPIIGQWCQCPEARLADRCSGKMICARAEDYLAGCQHFEQVLRDKTRFVLGISKPDVTLTHAQSMKIRCGGLEGMARLLDMDTPPRVLEVIARARERYASIEAFPFHEVVADIQGFSHRKAAGPR